jgi:protein-L-isoaspartate(D-aspartate) O-methyltransferase
MGRDIFDNQVLAAMAQVPRHLFVPPRLEQQAYDDHPLPIGHGVTISQPYIVALMTQATGIKPGDRVLEVGTGSGYQAAVLATLTDKVYSIELIPELAQSAGERLTRLGYRQVQVKSGDGYLGWPEFAPFDAIIVTAAAPEIPAALKDQLKDGGRLVIPVGPTYGPQFLQRLTKQGNTFKEEMLSPVAFVPLVKPKPSQ